MRRIGILVCLLALAAGGCGGGGRHASTSGRLPPRLAGAWARSADEVAAAVAAGRSCRASQLAQSLQADVIEREGSVPTRYRLVLLRAVNHLASGIACTRTTVVTTAPSTEPTAPAQARPAAKPKRAAKPKPQHQPHPHPAHAKPPKPKPGHGPGGGQ